MKEEKQVLREPKTDEERKIVEDYKRFAQKCPSLLEQTKKRKAYDEELEKYLKEVNRTLKKGLKDLKDGQNDSDINNFVELQKNFMGSMLSLAQTTLQKVNAIENYMATITAILQINYEDTLDGASEKEFREYLKEEKERQ